MELLKIFNNHPWKINGCNKSDNSGCSGCMHFVETLAGNERGRQALYLRFKRSVSGGDPFGPIRVCAMFKDDNIPVGVCDAGINNEHPKLAEVGILVDPTSQGNGIGKDLLKNMGRKLKRIGVQEIYSEINSNNLTAQRVAMKLGAEMDLEGNLCGSPDERRQTKWSKNL